HIRSSANPSGGRMTVVALSAPASRLSLGAPQSFRGLVAVPLVDRAATPSGLLTLDEALASGAAEVTEVSEAGAVLHLRLLNRGAGQLFLLDGEELAGAKQNRILNLSLLVPGGTALDIRSPASSRAAGAGATASAASPAPSASPSPSC